MKSTLFLLIAIEAVLFASKGFAQVTNFDSSPYIMQNSQFNMDNSPYNMRNSPYNMDNSAYNASAKNGVYDNTGNRVGYEVKADFIKNIVNVDAMNQIVVDQDGRTSAPGIFAAGDLT